MRIEKKTLLLILLLLLWLCYGCDQCNYKATTHRSLTRHKQNMKEFVMGVTSVTIKPQHKVILQFISNPNMKESVMAVKNVTIRP